MTSLIEDLRNTTGGPVVLMVHSYGGPILNYFLNTKSDQWRSENIHLMVALNAAWGGSAKSVKMYAIGDDLDNRIVDQTAIRNIQRTTPSLAFLLPEEELWEDRTVVYYNGSNITMQ